MKPFRDLFAWFDDRLGLSSTIMPVVRHPVPRNVNWWYVFGSASLTVFILQVITGVGLALNYVAAPNDAYQSLQFITEHATLGHLLRGMHYFGASAMVVLVLIHMTRVFLTGSFKYPRELNWLTGLALLGLTLTMAFTGQVLRWDENGYWSTVIAAEQIGRTPAIGQGLMHLLIGGNVVSGVTLTRFFSTHVFLVPALVFGFIGVHIYLVIHKGISEYPEPGKPVDPATYKSSYAALLKDGIPFFPDAVWKDMVFALAVVCLILALAIFVGPPSLANPANPAVIQTYPRPDWYFIWYFSVLALIPSGIETYVILGFPVAVFVALGLIPILANKGERSPRRRPWAYACVVIPLIFVAFLTRLGFEAPWSPQLSASTSEPIPPQIALQLNPEQRAGAEVFQYSGCRTCHQVGGSGGKRGPDLTNVGDRLTPSQLTIQIVNGSGNMPAFGGTLSSAEIESLVSFLSALRTASGEPAQPPPAATVGPSSSPP